MIKAHLILSLPGLIFSRLTDFWSVWTDFNSIWSEFGLEPDPNPTRCLNRVYNRLNPNFSLLSTFRPRLKFFSPWRFPARLGLLLRRLPARLQTSSPACSVPPVTPPSRLLLLRRLAIVRREGAIFDAQPQLSSSGDIEPGSPLSFSTGDISFCHGWEHRGRLLMNVGLSWKVSSF